MSIRRFALALALTSCVGGRPAPAPEAPPQPPAVRARLVESVPSETTLNHRGLALARDVWPALIDGARRTIDVEQFYVSDAPSSAMSRVVEALERAARRGVRVRLLVDEQFFPKYPEPASGLAKLPGVTLRRIDMKRLTGGVQHAKLFIVDDEDLFVGSQNFDWRALEHIQELGVHVHGDALAREAQRLFSADWALAAADAKTPPSVPPGARPVRARVLGDEGARITLLASPSSLLDHRDRDELSALVRALDGAARTIRLQVLTYQAAYRDGAPFLELDRALRRAAARGVGVEILVSAWAVAHADRGLAQLARTPGVRVRVLTVPPHSSGPIEFARVAHGKLLSVDGSTAWVGSSNWEGDYFTRSRNVSLLITGGRLAQEVERFFLENWASPYAAPFAATAGAAY